MSSQGDLLLLMGAIVVTTATFVIANSVLRKSSEEEAEPAIGGGRARVVTALVCLGLGLSVVAIGFSLASHDGVAPFALAAAALSVGSAATLPGAVLVTRGWERFAGWSEQRSSSNPPLAWLAGAVLAIVGFTMFAVFLPAVYFILTT